MGGDAMLPLARQISSSPLVEEIGYTSGYPTFIQLITSGKHEDLLKISCDAVAFEMLGFREAERFAQVEGSVMLSRSAANAHGITRENASPAAVYWGYENNPEDYPSVVGGIVEDFRTEPVNSSRHREGVPIVEVSSAGVPPKYIGAFLIRTGSDHRAFEEWFRPMVNAWHKEEAGISDVFHIKRAHNGYIEDLIAADHDDMRRYVRLVEVFCLISILLALLALVAISSHYADANAKKYSHPEGLRRHDRDGNSQGSMDLYALDRNLAVDRHPVGRAGLRTLPAELCRAHYGLLVDLRRCRPVDRTAFARFRPLANPQGRPDESGH